MLVILWSCIRIVDTEILTIILQLRRGRMFKKAILLISAFAVVAAIGFTSLGQGLNENQKLISEDIPNSWSIKI